MPACVPIWVRYKSRFKPRRPSFWGRVIALSIETRDVDGEGVEYMVATIDVKRLWKGPATPTIRISTCGDQVLFCTCGVQLRLGGSCIVVADREWPQVTSCGLTGMVLSESDPTVEKIEAVFAK